MKYNLIFMTRSYLLMFIFSCGVACARVQLTTIFTSQMVLQRQISVPVWGSAEPGETVTVSFAGQRKSVVTAADGRWLLRLDPLDASEQPQPLTVSAASGRVEMTDVLVGDVWLASGQSNMDFPVSSMKTAATVLSEGGDSGLRVFRVVKATAASTQNDLKGHWEAANLESIKSFSAVAYLFAKEIRRTQRVPVAILQSSWGGTPIKAWLPMQSLEQQQPLKPLLAEWQKAMQEHEAVLANPARVSEYTSSLARYMAEVYPAHQAALKAYQADLAAGKAVGAKPVPKAPEPQNPDPMAMPSPSKRPHTPTVIYNANIHPLIPFALRGVIWYQGEADGGNGLAYRELLPRLIHGWRAAWHQGDFPFLFVQLPANQQDQVPVATAGWPWLREAQLLTLRQVPHTGMAITLDIGDPKDVHPQNKAIVAARLALVGRKVAYGETIVSSGPLLVDHKVEGQMVRLRFTEIGSGLMIGQAPWVAEGNTSLPTDRLVGFYVAGSDQLWHEAVARIEGDTVIVTAPDGIAPVAVRYGWAQSPRANLYNHEGLPASPFRTDDWPR